MHAEEASQGSKQAGSHQLKSKAAELILVLQPCPKGLGKASLPLALMDGAMQARTECQHAVPPHIVVATNH